MQTCRMTQGLSSLFHSSRETHAQRTVLRKRTSMQTATLTQQDNTGSCNKLLQVKTNTIIIVTQCFWHQLHAGVHWRQQYLLTSNTAITQVQCAKNQNNISTYIMYIWMCSYCQSLVLYQSPRLPPTPKEWVPHHINSLTGGNTGHAAE